VSVSIRELNQRASALYAIDAGEDAEPEELPATARRAFHRAATEVNLHPIASTENETFSAVIWQSDDGQLVNCWTHTPNAQYMAEYFDGIGFDDDISWAYETGE
jgi:hypothetical protein